MTVLEALTVIYAERGEAEVTVGDDKTLAITLLNKSIRDATRLFRLPTHKGKETETIGAGGSSEITVPTDFHSIIGNVYVNDTRYIVKPIDDLVTAEKDDETEYCYIEFDTDTALWSIKFDTTLNEGDVVTYSYKKLTTDISADSDIIPLPVDIVDYCIYDVASKLSWLGYQPEIGEELKSRREQVYDRVVSDYTFFSNQNDSKLSVTPDDGDAIGVV